MKNKIVMVVVVVFFTAMAVTGVTTAANTGAVWAVDSNGNKNDYFNAGAQIYIEGSNLAHDASYTWTITDQDFSGSQKPSVAEGTGLTDSAGAIVRFDSGWSIPLNDYSVLPNVLDNSR